MRRDFADSLPERRASLETAWHTLQTADWDGDSLEAAYRVVHSLAGACETFGFSEPGQAARALNDYLNALVPSPVPPSEPERQRAQELYAALQETISDA